MTFVVDASTCLSWVLPDENPSPVSRAAQRALLHERALVPAIWPLEISNTLLVAERRKRLPKGAGYEVLTRLLELPIDLADETCELGPEEEQWIPSVHRLAQERKLTAYDAAYVLLAVRRRLPLASSDDRLLQAARALRIPVLEEPK